MPNISELIVILLICLLVFGANRLPQIGDGIGKAIKNFKRGMNTDDDIEVTPKAAKRVAANATGGKLDVDEAQDAEIVERCVYALVNEGARIVEEGIAARASDIDMIYLTGYGFPMFRGGPMLYADEMGLYNVARRMQAFAASSGDAFWEPAPLIAKLVAEGKSLT